MRIGERRIRTEARGVEDESCGYHPHHTVWDWSAGVGETRRRARGGWNLVSGINDPPRALRARDLGRRRAHRAAAGELRGPRGDRARRRRGSSSAPRPSAARSSGRPFALLLPPAVRQLHRDAAGRPRARSRARRDGAPRRPLVAALSPPARDRRTRPASARAAPRRARTRTGCARRGSRAGPAPGPASSSSGVEASRATSAVLSEPRDPLPAERGPVEPVGDLDRCRPPAAGRRPRRTRSPAGSRR